jgi:hypothetical protein
LRFLSKAGNFIGRNRKVCRRWRGKANSGPSCHGGDMASG